MDNIRKILKNSNYNLKDFADALEISERTLYRKLNSNKFKKGELIVINMMLEGGEYKNV